MTTIPACPPTPCREWRGATNTKGGYGIKRFNGKRRYVHRWVYSRVHGGFRGIHGREVMHLCDNPACYRYDHLFLGTHRDNMQDMMAKDRYDVHGSAGERNGLAKLKQRDVRELRQQYATGEWTLQQLGDEFGVDRSTIGKIITGTLWRTT